MAVSEQKTPTQAPELVRSAVVRMQAAPRFFNQVEWNALVSYEGPVVSGNPQGIMPDNLDEDDNE